MNMLSYLEQQFLSFLLILFIQDYFPFLVSAVTSHFPAAFLLYQADSNHLKLLTILAYRIRILHLPFYLYIFV
jgi:hypothetical protein